MDIRLKSGRIVSTDFSGETKHWGSNTLTLSRNALRDCYEVIGKIKGERIKHAFSNLPMAREFYDAFGPLHDNL